MSTPICPKDYILVTLDSKFKDSTSGGLFIETGFRPGHHTTVTGKVISTPLALSNHPQKRVINMEVKPGDEIAFAYRVVYNQITTDNAREIFHEDVLENPWITKWSNQKGEYLLRRNKGGGKFDAALFIIDGDKAVIQEKIDGSKEEVNAFIEKYKPSQNYNIVYKNLLWYNEEDLWKVDYQMAYAVKRGEDITMIGGYALLEHQKIDRQEYNGNIELFGDGRKKIDPELRTKLLAIGTPLKGQPKLSVKPGETVVINQHTAQEYNFWGTDYLLVRQDQILGKA